MNSQAAISNLESVLAFVKDFPKPGINFVDFLPILADPKLFAICINEMEKIVSSLEFDTIVALESRGFFFGLPLAMRLEKQFVPMRKKGKLPGEVVRESFEKEYGPDEFEIQKNALTSTNRVLIIDDLIATGGTLIAAQNLVKKTGATFVKSLCFIELVYLDPRSKLPNPEDLLTLIKIEENN